MPDLYFRLDDGGIILDWKAGCTSDLYLPPRKFVGRRVQDLFPGTLGNQFDQAIRQVLQTKLPVILVFSLPIRGEEQSYEARLLPLLDTQIVAIVRNITARKRAEEAVKIREAQLRRITNNMLDIITEIDTAGVIKYTSPSLKCVLGYDPEDRLGKSVFELVHPDDLDTIMAINRRTIKNGLRGRAEFRYRHADGHYVWLESTANPILDDSGGVAGFIIGTREITERKLAEEEAHLAARVFENISEGIAVINIDGVILSVNPAFSKITEYSAQEVIGKKLSTVICEPGNEQFCHTLWAHLKEDGLWQGEISHRRKNGEVYTLWMSVNVLRDEQVGTVNYVAVLSDITEQVKLGEERDSLQVHTSRAQRLASLSTLSAAIIHEITQPLNAIKVLADGALFWQEKNGFLDAVEAIESLREISSQAGRINEVIRYIRSFASAGTTTELVPCNLNNAVNRALDLLGRQLSAHGIVVRKNLSENLLEVLGDTKRLEEIVINLLVNAMQALDVVDYPEKEISCVTYMAGEKVILEVVDNGTGVPDDIQDSIFEPLFTTKEIINNTISYFIKGIIDPRFYLVTFGLFPFEVVRSLHVNCQKQDFMGGNYLIRLSGGDVFEHSLSG